MICKKLVVPVALLQQASCPPLLTFSLPNVYSLIQAPPSLPHSFLAVNTKLILTVTSPYTTTS